MLNVANVVEQLAIFTLNSMATIAWLATRGDNKPKQNTPPIQASSKDEENFIQYVTVDVKSLLDLRMLTNSLQRFHEADGAGREEGKALDSSIRVFT
ncbi:hypothetical protein MRB53_040124 [Persea americana]|nr:hypothetical protein MRB53_040124 [Persea americana]